MPQKYELVFLDSSAFAASLKKVDRGVVLLTRAALTNLLQSEGLDLAGTRWIKSLGGGLWEFRLGPTTTQVLSGIGLDSNVLGIHHQRLLLRVFFTLIAGDRILIIAIYDKGKDPSKKRQQREIAEARAKLREFQHKSNH
ncbi:MAG: hypothetical protein ACKOWK_03200 [Micrococcales bacterium]